MAMPSLLEHDFRAAVSKHGEGARNLGSTMEKVLILDGCNRSALAATRSLGRKGVKVVVADETPSTLASGSRYCLEDFTYPSPNRYPEAFINVLKQEADKRQIKVMMPMTEITTSVILKERAKFNGLIIPFAPFEAFDQLTNKWWLLELARDLGISVPRTHFVHKPDELNALRGQIDFPAVLKPFRSRICCGPRWLETAVRYAGSFEEIERMVAQFEFLNQHPFMIQECVRGQGEGVFTLYNQGQAVVFFGHRRLRENPPSGGVSVLSESIVPNPKAQEAARKLLDFIRWHGVAMVEFKVAEDGTPYLMEVNARFWGSLQLAIDAGVDFPWLLYQLATGQPVDPIGGYKLGVKNRWLLGDAAHLYKSLIRGKDLDMPHGQKWRTLLDFVNFFDRETRYEVNRWDDPLPFVAELKQRFLH